MSEQTNPAGHTAVHVGDMERDGPWTLVRRSLGLGAFGVNLVEIAPGTSIPAHDETASDQEELYAVLSGDAVAVLDGVRVRAPEGTFVRVAPEVHRTLENPGGSPVTALIVGAPRGSGFTPLEWC